MLSKFWEIIFLINYFYENFKIILIMFHQVLAYIFTMYLNLNYLSKL